MMPINHIVLVPVTIVVGIAIGYWWGTRTVRQQWEKAERRRRQTEAS